MNYYFPSLHRAKREADIRGADVKGWSRSASERKLNSSKTSRRFKGSNIQWTTVYVCKEQLSIWQDGRCIWLAAQMTYIMYSYSITRLLSYSNTQLLDYSITQLLCYSINQLLKYSITRSLDYTLYRFRIGRWGNTKGVETNGGAEVQIEGNAIYTDHQTSWKDTTFSEARYSPEMNTKSSAGIFSFPKNTK